MVEITIRLEEAKRLIEEAERALERGDFDSCCITSCYAIFHIVRALILKLGMNPKKLDDAIHLICMDRERIGLSREDCANIYRALDIKSEIDDGHLRRVTEDVARRTLEDAKVIYEKAEKFIRA